MVRVGMSKEVIVQFVWSDDLALLLLDRGEAKPGQVDHWMSRPIGHRLSEDETPLSFARGLLKSQMNPDQDRLAS